VLSGISCYLFLIYEIIGNVGTEPNISYAHVDD